MKTNTTRKTTVNNIGTVISNYDELVTASTKVFTEKLGFNVFEQPAKKRVVIRTGKKWHYIICVGSLKATVEDGEMLIKKLDMQPESYDMNPAKRNPASRFRINWEPLTVEDLQLVAQSYNG